MPKTIPTLLEFATDDILTRLLIKERAKCRRRNRTDKNNHLDPKCNSNRMKLNRMMPPRRSWVRPRKNKREKLKLPNKANDTCKIAEKALFMTIKRDRELQEAGTAFPYLDEMKDFFKKIRDRLAGSELSFDKPELLPIFKSEKRMPDGKLDITCRPLAAYQLLEDKIILAVTRLYLAKYLDKYLHNNILSYRPARNFGDKDHHVTDFNDGINLIQDFCKKHNVPIYVADCDIKKFYDCFSHSVVIQCFERILARACFGDEAQKQVMRVLKAYLDSYNFYTNVWEFSQNKPNIFHKLHRKYHDPKGDKNNYHIDWVDEIRDLPIDEQCQRGVPQGGALSLMIANVVLNDVDQVIVEHDDPDRLFIRYCDDMILMHTDRDECARLIQAYADALTDHGLYYHGFKHVEKDSKKPQKTTPAFWQAKSHHTFLWADGEGEANRYIGFLGYEARRNGNMRLRRSNMMNFNKKLKRICYAIQRFQCANIHDPDKIQEHRDKTFKTILEGTNFYSAFNQDRFRRGKQYRHQVKLVNKAKERLERHEHDYAERLLAVETDSFVPLAPTFTGLSCFIYLDSGKLCKKRKHPLWLYVQTPGGCFLPITIGSKPTAFRDTVPPNFDIAPVLRFIKANHRPLKQLADCEITLPHLIPQLRK